jgi:tetratricopeptide (TPR) repeat protein
MTLQPGVRRVARVPMRPTTALALVAALSGAALVVVAAVAWPAARQPMTTAVAASPAPIATPPTASPPAVAGGAVLSLDERVAFWQARVESSAGDYLGSLQLVDALLDRSRATGDLADLERASAVLDRAAPLAPAADAGLELRRGQVAFALHDFRAARAAAEDVLQLAPGDAAGLALLGDAALETGDDAAAAEAYGLLAAEGRTPPILARLARLAWLTGDLEEAEALLVEAIVVAQADGFADRTAFHHFQLAELLRGRNELDRAAEEYAGALSENPEHVPSMGGLARIRDAQGRRAEAIQLLEGATARIPAPELVAALGDLYVLAGDLPAAARQWALVERIAEVGRAAGGVYDRQLVLFWADHDLETDAAVDLAEAELAERTDVYGYDALAWALYRAGRFPEADAAAAEALRSGTPDGRILYHAGLIAEALGRDDDARILLGKAAASSGALPPLQVPALEAALERLGNP